MGYVVTALIFFVLGNLAGDFLLPKGMRGEG